MSKSVFAVYSIKYFIIFNELILVHAIYLLSVTNLSELLSYHGADVIVYHRAGDILRSSSD